MFLTPIQQIAAALMAKKVIDNTGNTAQQARETSETLKKIEKQNEETLKRIRIQKQQIKTQSKPTTKSNSSDSYGLYDERRLPDWQQPKYLRNKNKKNLISKKLSISNKIDF